MLATNPALRQETLSLSNLKFESYQFRNQMLIIARVTSRKALCRFSTKARKRASVVVTKGNALHGVFSTQLSKTGDFVGGLRWHECCASNGAEVP
jgi:hypothetical protein